MGLEKALTGMKKTAVALLSVPIIMGSVGCNYRTIHPGNTGMKIEINRDGSRIHLHKSGGFLRGGEYFDLRGSPHYDLKDIRAREYTLFKHVDVRWGPLKDGVNDNSTVAGRARLKVKQCEAWEILNTYYEGIENYINR